jgi:hypothetical protein
VVKSSRGICMKSVVYMTDDTKGKLMLLFGLCTTYKGGAICIIG